MDLKKSLRKHILKLHQAALLRIVLPIRGAGTFLLFLFLVTAHLGQSHLQSTPQSSTGLSGAGTQVLHCRCQQKYLCGVEKKQHKTQKDHSCRIV